MEKEWFLALWNITDKCNFRCNYCINEQQVVEGFMPHLRKMLRPLKKAIRSCFKKKRFRENADLVDKILDTLNETGEKWEIQMTGGEPFLVPNFIEVCEKLTRNHYISINSNLSIHKKVVEFTNKINSDRVNDLTISAHIEEREKRNGVDTFINDLLLLKNKGFKFTVKYILHPILTKRFQNDYEYFESKGIRLVPARFVGCYNSVLYPKGYSKTEMEIINKDKSFGPYPIQSKGRLCNAGRNFIWISQSGDVSLCAAVFGNVFDPKIKLNTSPKPCRHKMCYCLGHKFILNYEGAR